MTEQEQHHDVAVVGLGAIGSAALRVLAARGVNVIGLEQFDPPHDRGSYAGHSRAFRLAYYEHPDYVPLLQLAYDLWKQLEHDTDEQLFIETGGLYVGDPQSPLIAGSLAAAGQHGVPCESLTADDVRAHWPQFKVPHDFAGIFEPRGGILLPEKIVQASLDLAADHGAVVRARTPVVSIETQSDASAPRVVITTANGEMITADRIIVCAGAWTTKLLGDIGVPLRVSRQTLGWFDRPTDAPATMFSPDHLPMWGWDDPDGIFRYGFPELPGQAGVKIAHHNPGETVDPDTFNRTPTTDEASSLHASFEHVFGSAGSPKPCAIQTCIYTNTPDEHFIIDTHPRSERIIIAAGFSGHGFKFASSLGVALADVAMTGRSDLPIDFLSLRRFAKIG